MEKKKIEVHAVTIHMYTIIIAILVILLAFVSLKYLHLKFAVHGFTQGTMLTNMIQDASSDSSVSDYGNIVAVTIANYPASKPLWSDSQALQNYVVTLSKDLKRDIVVVDTSRKVLADTVAANVGSNYAYDQNHEIDQTVKDGVSRTFVEKSTDYPQGISETVVAVKDASNKIVGVVLVSSEQIGK